MSDTNARAAIARMNLKPVALSPVHSTMEADLQQMAKAEIGAEHEKFMARRGEICAAFGMNSGNQDKPFAFANGIAVIPVSGSLINRFGGSYGYVTGYNFLRRQLNQAIADDDVKGIVLDVNSNGGEAAGCFELSSEIRAMRAVKPITAVIDTNCYSAAYAIASAATTVVATPSGGAGSIGVVAMHMDMSKMLDSFGIKVTFIKFGDRKVDGNPYEALSEDAKNDIQASVDEFGERFISQVAENRSLNPDTVRGTQARVFSAKTALELGLIDKIATPHEAIQQFHTTLVSSNTLKGNSMSGTTEQKPAASAAEPKAADAAQETTAAAATAVPAAQSQDARAEERARISGILSLDEAKGKSALANHLALNTNLSLDEAKGILAASAEAPAASSTNAFAAAMSNTANPEMDAGSQGSTQLTAAQRILQAQAGATGLKLN